MSRSGSPAQRPQTSHSRAVSYRLARTSAHTTLRAAALNVELADLRERWRRGSGVAGQEQGDPLLLGGEARRAGRAGPTGRVRRRTGRRPACRGPPTTTSPIRSATRGDDRAEPALGDGLLAGHDTRASSPRTARQVARTSRRGAAGGCRPAGRAGRRRPAWTPRLQVGVGVGVEPAVDASPSRGRRSPPAPRRPAGARRRARPAGRRRRAASATAATPGPCSWPEPVEVGVVAVAQPPARPAQSA